MLKDNVLKYSGIATILTLWLSVGYAMHVVHLSLVGHWPLSYLGSNVHSEPYFRAGLILGAAWLSLFYVYLKKHFVINGWFTPIFFIGQIGQIVAAVVPFYGDPTTRIVHTGAAFVLAFSIPAFMYLFAKTQHDIRLRNLAYKLLWVEVIAFIVGIGWFVVTHNAAPLSQALPAIAFHLWIFKITFIQSQNIAQRKSV